MSSSPPPLTGSRVLARNSLLNLTGSMLPMLAALASIPLLIGHLGEARFGVLTVAWVVIGYFSLFDLGFGLALTKLVAEKLGAGEREELPGLVWTALLLMLVLGIVGTATLLLVTPWLVGDLLQVPAELQGEVRQVFYVLALSLPFVISTAGLHGVLEANQSFGVVNALRVPMGLFNYLAPLAVFPFSTSLVPVVVLLASGRVLAWGASLFSCLRVLPVLRRRVRPQWSQMGGLARFGGWLTVSNVVSPLMTNLDRFLIGALISMTAVAYYVTPYEVVTKFMIFPLALMRVFFPAFAASFAQDRSRTALLFDRGVRAIFLVIFPITLVVFTLAYDGMRLWLGHDFAVHSTAVLRWLALGVFMNCLAQVPFALVQGAGRPDIPGKLHLLELPLYAVGIWALSARFGLEGVAMAWMLRATLDAAVLFVAAARVLPDSSAVLRSTGQLVLGAAAVFGFAGVQHGLGMKVTFLAGVLVLFAPMAWWKILAPAERALVQRRSLVDT